jgi:hypothetical protein
MAQQPLRYRVFPDQQALARTSRYLGIGEGKDPFRSALMEVILLLSVERDLQEAYN